MKRKTTFLDAIILQVDQGLKTLSGNNSQGLRQSPAQHVAEDSLSEKERQQTIGLMRVNHSGEVCAQALYQGQALTASHIKGQLITAAQEERDHLHWCRERVEGLGGHVSYLNLLWYSGSFCLGALVGLAGDRLSLGFLAETEHQVEAHLSSHLRRLPKHDAKSRAIVSKMRAEEGKHATGAIQSGGQPLPFFVRGMMRLLARCMTGTSYYF